MSDNEKNDSSDAEKAQRITLDEAETKDFKLWAAACDSVPANLSGADIDQLRADIDKRKQEGTLEIKEDMAYFNGSISEHNFQIPERPVGALTQEHLDMFKRQEVLRDRETKDREELYGLLEARGIPLGTEITANDVAKYGQDIVDLNASIKEVLKQRDDAFYAKAHDATMALRKAVEDGDVHIKGGDTFVSRMCQKSNYHLLKAANAFSDLKFANETVPEGATLVAPPAPPKTPAAAGQGYLLDTSEAGQAHLIFLSGVEKSLYSGWQNYVQAYQEQCPDQTVKIDASERGYMIQISGMDGNELRNMINQGLSEIASGNPLSANSCAVEKPGRGR